MSKYLVETFYTCSFKIVHKLDELNEKKLSELEGRNDGSVQVIDIKLNNRKTKKIGKKNDSIVERLLIIFINYFSFLHSLLLSFYFSSFSVESP